MSGLQCVGSQDSAREHLASKTNHLDSKVFLLNFFVNKLICG
jgi:hypothetical protein